VFGGEASLFLSPLPFFGFQADHDAGYASSSIPRAALVGCRGLNVSHITASSSVHVAPREPSIVPGCGPWGMPCGCRLIDPDSIPFRAL